MFSSSPDVLAYFISLSCLYRLTSKRRKRRRLAVPSVECSITGDLLMWLLDLEREEDQTQMLLEVLQLFE